MSTSTAPTKPAAKTAKKSLIAHLRLPSDLLARFPSDNPPRPSISSPANGIEPSPSVTVEDAGDKTSESNGTPMPPPGADGTDSNSLAPPKVDRRRRGGAATSTGRKRAPPSIDPNGPIRERGRPGPKKKPRLPDGTIDRSQDPNKPIPHSAPSRLGPKANTGNINANLRALDRTGTPCRKWHRQPLSIKSFTGVQWGMASWKAPPRGENGFAGDVKSDSTGSSDMKRNDSSAVPSDRSNNGAMEGVLETAGGMPSSPAPAPPPIAA